VEKRTKTQKSRPSSTDTAMSLSQLFYALGTQHRYGKLNMDNIVKGIFLGYHNHWSSIASVNDIITPPEKFCIFAESTPFIITCSLKFPITCTFEPLGLVLESGPMLRHNFIVDVLAFSSVSELDWEHDFCFKTIVQVEANPVFLVLDVHRALSHVKISTHDVVTFILTEYSPEPSNQSSPLPHIAMDKLRAVHHVIHGWDLADHIILVTAENAATMAFGQALTRRSCLKGPHRANWIVAESAQLDKYHSYGMYGPPLSCSAVPPTLRQGCSPYLDLLATR
jgi:hypothetical protein